jgi:hypothetical protein
MAGGAAPIVFISYSHDSEEHKAHVGRFAAFLRRRIGLDVRLDQWDDNVRRDWALWATRLFNTADFVIVIASPDFRARADGEAQAHEGRGAQFEAAFLRNALTKDHGAATQRILPVVLPGGSVDDIPTFLSPYSATHFKISEFTWVGVAELRHAITGIGEHNAPELGVWQGEVPPAPAGAATVRWLRHSAGVRVADAVIDGNRCPQSIVMRVTPAFVEIELGGAFERFTSVVGVLDDARERHQVARFRVLVDRAPVAAGRVSLGMSCDVDVSVAGGALLRLEVFRPGGSAELAWGDPTLS